LPIVAGINFLIDSGISFLAIGSDYLYVFGVVAIFSLLCFGSILSGVQEEQGAKIKLAIGWVLIKMALFLLLIISAIAALANFYWFTEFSMFLGF
jgi:hypothetical protein